VNYPPPREGVPGLGIALGRDRAMPGTFRRQPLFAHQPGHPLARALDPWGWQLGMDPRAAVHATIGLENACDLVGEFGIFSAVLARRALAPGRGLGSPTRRAPGTSAQGKTRAGAAQ
jgi:hypothetical protein